jgi:hypothetical protein
MEYVSRCCIKLLKTFLINFPTVRSRLGAKRKLMRAQTAKNIGVKNGNEVKRNGGKRSASSLMYV